MRTDVPRHFVQMIPIVRAAMPPAIGGQLAIAVRRTEQAWVRGQAPGAVELASVLAARLQLLVNGSEAERTWSTRLIRARTTAELQQRPFATLLLELQSNRNAEEIETNRLLPMLVVLGGAEADEAMRFARATARLEGGALVVWPRDERLVAASSRELVTVGAFDPAGPARPLDRVVETDFVAGPLGTEQLFYEPFNHRLVAHGPRGGVRVPLHADLRARTILLPSPVSSAG
jgi:hypothetical protein